MFGAPEVTPCCIGKSRITQPCHIYLIPLKNNPVFKIGNAVNVPNRIKNMGVLRHVDHDKAVVIDLPDKKSAQIVEKSLHLRLHPFRSSDIPDDIRNGQTEYFGIDAWDIALDFIADLTRGWNIKISTWNKPRRKLAVPVKPQKPRTLRKRLRNARLSKVCDRYNRSVFSRYWSEN